MSKPSAQTQKQAADAGVVLRVVGKARPVVWMRLLVIAVCGASAIRADVCAGLPTDPEWSKNSCGIAVILQ